MAARGRLAARMATGLGADVSIIDRSLPRLRQLDELFQGRVRTRFSTIDAIEEEIRGADVIIGSVLVPGASAPKLITRDMLGLLQLRTMLVDVEIDQGGCFETGRPTTHAEPTFDVDGILHYCVANIPGSVPRTSSHALNNATLPYGLARAQGGLKAIAENPAPRAGLAVHRGRLTSKPVAESLDLPFASVSEAVAR